MSSVLDTQEPFVAFVGAGASMLRPSSLPSWTEFNDLLLHALAERLGEYSGNRQPTAQMLAAFRERRDKGGFLSPDFQAQLMEEEIGATYFSVWQSLETDRYGPVHYGLAELAARGGLAAIVTTNFDRLIETALSDRGVAFEVVHDRASFDAFAQRTAQPHGVLPVLKIHGSIEDTASLVDTLRQRVAGRPPSLEATLARLLRESPWLFLGFSGADFGYNPHYLGILDAADDAKGFVFVEREGVIVQRGVLQLADAYGPAKASIVRGDLAHWLSETLLPDAPPFVAGEDTAAPRVRERIAEWVDGLGPMAVVNIMCGMLRSAGLEPEAMWLVRRTWKSYRSGEDASGPSYDRYNYNYGLSLFERGFITNPVERADDMSNMMEWKAAADQNAFEFFARGFSSGNLLASGAQLAALLAYRGEVGRALGLTSEVTDRVIALDDKLAFCDVALASVPVYDILQLFTRAAPQLHTCMAFAKELGDEPRRALLAAHLGRFLCYAGHPAEAEEFIVDAEHIGSRLDLPQVLLAAHSARGAYLLESRQWDANTVATLQQVADVLHARDDVPVVTKVDLAQAELTPVEVKGYTPELCRVLLDLNRAALFSGDGDVMNRTLDELDVVATQIFPGYCPHYYFAYVDCLMAHGADDATDRMHELIGRARVVGEQSGNPWVATAADRYEAHLAERGA